MSLLKFALTTDAEIREFCLSNVLPRDEMSETVLSKCRQVTEVIESRYAGLLEVSLYESEFIEASRHVD